jgi:DNA ligase-1
MLTFSETCEKIAATTKKLEKERILAGYLQSLIKEDLAIAAVFMSGSPFALREQRTTSAGFAVVRDALLEIAPNAVEKFGEALLQTGDPGAAVAQILEASGHNVRASLHLKEVQDYYHKLGETGSLIKKRIYTTEILRRATPLEAKYITKILIGGMRIGLQESLVESSIAKAFQQPLKQVQLANMLIGDIGETALMARDGKLDRARMQLLHPIKPMLASPEEDVSKILEYMNGTGLAEDKYDGIRAQIHKDANEIRIYSRDLDDITASFPDVVAAMSQVEGSFLMDGEIVPYRDDQILSFAELQIRLGRKLIAKEILEAVPARYFAFDILYINGELLLSQPLTQRKSHLFNLWKVNQTSFSPSTSRIVQNTQALEEAFEAARIRNNEGLVIKHPDSAYTPGKRGKSWLKLKRTLATLDVVVVAAEYGHGKRAGVLSDYTFAVQHKGELLTIGKAYSGITDAELQQLSSLFHEISLGNRGYYHPVKPHVVLEVTFDRINRSDRHSSGFALRFPRIKRIRWDKKPEEIDTLETVENLHKNHFGG